MTLNSEIKESNQERPGTDPGPIANLLQRIAGLEARVQELETGRGLWSPHDRALRRQLATSTEGKLFLAGELVRHAEADPSLANAIGAAFLERTAASLGTWLRDHRGSGDGIRIERVRRYWRVTSHTSCVGGVASVG
jgi:hypothetical protein